MEKNSSMSSVGTFKGDGWMGTRMDDRHSVYSKTQLLQLKWGEKNILKNSIKKFCELTKEKQN